VSELLTRLRIDALGKNVPSMVRQDCHDAAERIAELEAEIETRDNQWAVLNGMSQSRAAQLETMVEAFQAACEHPREDWFYHSGVSNRENDFRCNKCNLVFNVPEDELSNTSWKPHKPSGGA
jgi:hypothetical protein